MKKIVVIGAFDRYNYGDNLMPILFELFLKEFYPEIISSYEIVYSALTDSDLTKYKAKKTIAMYKALDKKNESVHSIISIGGEVLCASSSTLFLHMNNTKKNKNFVVFLRKHKMKVLADLFCKHFYKLPWEYPYIPPKDDSRLTAFNTVGGGMPKRSLRNFNVYFSGVVERLANADYLSVRDKRGVSSLKNFSNPKLYPDSAIVMADFITDDFLLNECKEDINQLMKKNYICFQAAPKKSDASAEEWVNILKKLSQKYNLDIVLCPIGYANGHDDFSFLKEIKDKSSGDFTLLYELNLWEILSTIKNSKIFLGTSLHGVITALSFSVPYVGLNPKVDKLNSFLKEWGISPSTRSYAFDEIPDIVHAVFQIKKDDFNKHSVNLRNLGMKNNHELVNALYISENKDF